MRTEQKREKLVSNRTDSSVSVDERQIKESRCGWQRSLPLPDLSRKIEGSLLAGYHSLNMLIEARPSKARLHLNLAHAHQGKSRRLADILVPRATRLFLNYVSCSSGNGKK